MSLFRRPACRWAPALILSLFAHFLVVAGFVFLWPEVSSRRTGPRIDSKPHHVRLEHRRLASRASSPGGEENSENMEGLGATIKSGLLIEPKLELTPSTIGPVKAVEMKSQGAAGTAPHPAKGASGSGKASNGARFFNIDAKARRVVYVLDASSSMGRDGLWRQAGQELVHSLDSLADGVEFQVIVYHSHARYLIPARPGWLSWDVETSMQVHQALRDLAPEGKTNHGPAINLALSMRPDAVFFLTDADDLSFELLRQVESWNHARAVIHTVELNARESRPGMPLQLLAQRHGGQYQMVGKR